MRFASIAAALLVATPLALTAAAPKSGPPIQTAAGDAPPQLVTTGPRWKNLEQLRRFAAQGDPQACFELGDRLVNGDGLAVDPVAARDWLKRAARGGVAEAMFRLGKLHNDGLGGPQNLALALDYYVQAARHNIPEAQHNIGAMLVSGRGVKRDYVEGLAWLIAAEKNGAASDAVARTRQHLAKRPADIAAAEKRAAELLDELKDPAKRTSVSVRFAAAGARSASPVPLPEPKREAPPKVRVELAPNLPPPKPPLDLPKT